MQTNEFVKIMLYLGTAYNRTIEQGTIQIWYEYFKETEPNVLMQAVKNTAVESEYFPTLAKLIAECKKIEENFKYVILEKMLKDGYFKWCAVGEQSELEEMSDYNKAVMFASREIIPSWLEEDMIKYGYKKPTNYNPNNRLTTNTTKFLSE